MTTTPPETGPAASAGGMGIPFAVASRPQRRFSNTQTVDNRSAGSFQVVQLPATGWVRRLNLLFTVTSAFSAGGGFQPGDGPFNLVSGITLTDATGQPVMQPISGFNLYLVNKYMPRPDSSNYAFPFENPVMTPEFGYSSTATTAVANFRLTIDFEVDSTTGYGCIPNLDSNASLQLKVDFAGINAAFTGTATSSSISMRVSQEYWAPVSTTIGGVPSENTPPGAGDYLETRYETQPVSAASENLVNFTNRGGLVKGIIMVSRNAGVRTAITPASNLGILLDNQPINEGIPIEEHYDYHRRIYGYYGQDIATPTNPGAGNMSGLDRGVVPVFFGGMSGGRNSWLNTRAGSLFQSKITPGAGAGSLEIITQLMQVKDPVAFYDAR